MDSIATKVDINLEVDVLMTSCRVCMAHSLKMNNIFDTKSRIVNDILYCTGVRMKREDGFPSKICDSCLRNLSVAYKFKSSCLLADETFRKFKEDIKTEGTDDNIDIYGLEYFECDDVKDTKVKSDDCIEEYIETDFKQTLGDDKREIPLIKSSTPKLKVKSFKKRGPYKTKGVIPVRQKKFTFKKLFCIPCGIKFDSKEQSDEHRRQTHPGDNKWICEFCGKQFVHQSSHYAHIRSHQPPQYHCDHCQYSTWHRADLVKHLRIHNGLKLYQCEHCTSRYYTSSNLRSHIRRDHEAQRPHSCEECGAAFFDKSKLRRHIDTHNKIKRYTCELCNGSFTRRYHWKAHLLRQHGVTVPPKRPGRQKTNFLVGSDHTTVSMKKDSK